LKWLPLIELVHALFFETFSLFVSSKKEKGTKEDFMKYFMIAIMFLVLVGCGQGNQSKEVDNKTGYEKELSSFEVKIPVFSEDEAVRVVRDFISSELDEMAFSGLYLDHDPKTHLVILIQEEYLNEDIAANLLAFAEKNGKTDSKFLIELKPAKHSYHTLDTIMNKLNDSHQDLFVTDRRVLSFGMNEMENRIDLHVSTKADLNLELLHEITAGDESIIHITEGILSSVDDNGIPTDEPYIIGKIMKLDKESRRILVEDQIYFTIDDVTIIKDSDGHPIEEASLQVGDEVKVWTDGAILESLPAQGYAVVIQKIN
jgi:hypothetical protein